MSRAKVSLEDVKNVSKAVSVAESTATSTVAQIESSVENNISTLESAYQQVETVLSTCNRSLTQLQRMRMETERRLNALKKELCNTPPKIEKTETGEDGEPKTVKKDNPRYIQLLHEISAVTQKIGEYNSLIRNFNALASDCAKQKEMISAAKYSLCSICDELKATKDKYTTKCETAIKRLSDISAMIDAYMSVRISGGSSSGVSYSAPTIKSGGFGSFVTKAGATGAMFFAALSGATPNVPIVEQPQDHIATLESIGDSVNAGKIAVNGYEVVLDDSVQREESVEHLTLKEGAQKMVGLGGDVVENAVDSLKKKKRAEKELEMATEENNKPKVVEPYQLDGNIFITVDKDGKIVKYDVKYDFADNDEASTVTTTSYNVQSPDKSGKGMSQNDISNITEENTVDKENLRLTPRQYVEYLAAKNGYSSVKEALNGGAYNAILTAEKISLKIFDLDALTKEQIKTELNASSELLRLRKDQLELADEIAIEKGQYSGISDKKVLTRILIDALKDYDPNPKNEFISAEVRTQEELGINPGWVDGKMLSSQEGQTIQIELPCYDDPFVDKIDILDPLKTTKPKPTEAEVKQNRIENDYRRQQEEKRSFSAKQAINSNNKK